MSDQGWLECMQCTARYEITHDELSCACGGLLDVQQDLASLKLTLEEIERRRTGRSVEAKSGVWRYRELVLPGFTGIPVSHPEGNTRLYEREKLARWVGVDWLRVKHEGENPTGFFKDRGMTAGMTHALRAGARAVCCASTGNTSASLAAYAAHAGLPSFVFVPTGKIAMGKLSQALAYGATVLAIRGDFDAAMALVREHAQSMGLYLLNSINPFRIEGQKTIMLEILEDLEWEVPDWYVFPAGNLGNTSAFGKALQEAKQLGWIKKTPRLAAIQASGANPFFQSFRTGFKERFRVKADTIATAIRIGDPVSFDRAARAIEGTDGVVEEVTDEEILEAKAMVDVVGLGCEPASAASIAGARKLREAGVIKPGDKVVTLLTGNLLKDSDTTLARFQRLPGEGVVEVEADHRLIAREIEGKLRA